MKYATAVSVIFLSSLILIPLARADWAMFGADPSHSGVGTNGPVSGPSQLWNYSTPGEPISSTAAVSNGVVYIGLDDGALSNWGSYVDAFNATTGSFIWRYGKMDTMSSPAVVNGVVYISGNFSVFALNAATGQQIWRYVTNWTAGTPTVNDGVVYVGCSGPGGMEANRFFALNADSGELIWNFTLRDDPESPAAFYGGVVYLNVGGTEGRLYAIDAANGKELWSYPTAFGGSPAVANGVVYAGSADCNFYALNAKTGSIYWTFNVTGQQWISGTSPAVSGGIVYTSSGNGSVYALNAADGSLVWSYATQGVWNNYTYPVSGSFAIASGAVYFGAGNGVVYALNAANGVKLWNFTLPRYHDNGWAIGSSPVVDNGVLYIGSFYGCLYAFGNAPTSNPTPSPTSTSTPIPTSTPTPPQTTPYPSVTPSITPSAASTIQAAKNDGANITLSLNGNITSQQISSATLTTNQSANTTTIGFILTGLSGSTGFGNVTVPKSAVSYGTTASIFIDNQKAENQGFTQDADNYYVWFTTHFSTHELSIVFTTNAQTQTQQPLGLVQIVIIGVSAILALAAIGGFVFALKKGKN